jgi:hypothetical protein
MLASIHVRKYSGKRTYNFQGTVSIKTICDKKKSKARKNVRVGAGAGAITPHHC